MIVAVMAAACIYTCCGLGFSLALTSAIPVAATLMLLVAVAMFARTRSRPRLLAGAVAFLQMTSFTGLGVVLSYALAATGGSLWDGRLTAADVRLQLDWPAILHAADAWPMMLWVGAAAYYSLVAQMIVCIVVLSAAGRIEHLRTAIAAAVLSGAVTVAISGAMPAIGNLFDPAAYHHLWPSVAWQERRLVAGLRDGSMRVLDLSRLSGIVSFPSYHATLPVILAWAQRDVPVLNVVAPIWAGVTILATPLFGGHYGVDVLAGIGLALLALALASRLAGRSRHGSPMLMPGRFALVYPARVKEGFRP